MAAITDAAFLSECYSTKCLAISWIDFESQACLSVNSRTPLPWTRRVADGNAFTPLRAYGICLNKTKNILNIGHDSYRPLRPYLAHYWRESDVRCYGAAFIAPRDYADGI